MTLATPRQLDIGTALWLYLLSTAGKPEGNADVAQLVEHHLAKVGVAGSNPVVRSGKPVKASHGGLAERRGNGLQSRVHGFESRTHLASEGDWRSGSALP